MFQTIACWFFAINAIATIILIHFAIALPSETLAYHGFFTLMCAMVGLSLCKNLS